MISIDSNVSSLVLFFRSSCILPALEKDVPHLLKKQGQQEIDGPFWIDGEIPEPLASTTLKCLDHFQKSQTQEFEEGADIARSQIQGFVVLEFQL